MANSVDPDQMPHIVAFDLNMYCFLGSVCLSEYYVPNTEYSDTACSDTECICNNNLHAG